jgi:nucleoside-diphosphate-sugar epimerase
MRALVTGATGFVGSHLVDHLLAHGYEVRCIVRSTSNLQWLARPEVELFFSTLVDPDKLKAAMKDVDVVFLVAGSLIEKDWNGFYNANVKPVKLLLDAALKTGGNLKRFVLVGSTGAMGPSPDGRPLNELDSCHPISEYGRSKLEGERVAEGYHKLLPISIVRPSAVYGPRDPNFVTLFKQTRSGIAPVIGRRDPYFNLIHVEDLAEGMIAAAEKDVAIGNTYVLASERPYARSEIMDTIGEVYGRKATRVVIPIAMVPVIKAWSSFRINVLNKPTLLDPDRLDTITAPYWTFDISKAMKDLGFKEAFSLKSGLQQTYDWYVQHDWLNKDQGR